MVEISTVLNIIINWFISPCLEKNTTTIVFKKEDPLMHCTGVCYLPDTMQSTSCVFSFSILTLPHKIGSFVSSLHCEVTEAPQLQFRTAWLFWTFTLQQWFSTQVIASLEAFSNVQRKSGVVTTWGGGEAGVGATDV